MHGEPMTAFNEQSFLMSPAIRSTVAQFEAAVTGSGGVLIVGERATGRETVARALHQTRNIGLPERLEDLFCERGRGADAAPPFVILDCAAADDVEEELFGRCTEAGGAEVDRVCASSRFVRSWGGTLFLRDLQEMPRRVQLRLARILRDGQVTVENGRGEARLEILQVRPIAAIEPGFAGDADDRIVPELLRRVSERHLYVPPLRDRREDMPGLVRCLLEDICRSMNLPRKAASKQAGMLLASLPWRGNLRELREVLRSCVLKVVGRRITMADVLSNVRLDGGARGLPMMGTLKQAREQFEREYVAAVLAQNQGRMAAAASALGIQRTNLYRKVRQLAVERSRRPSAH
jgi:DNA-binding NtrC family response regulator